MRILVVAATAMEIAPFVEGLQCTSAETGIRTYRWGGHDVEVLVTGVGMVATAAWVSRALERAAREQRQYEKAFNFGVCGSFDPALGPGTVVHVVLDHIAELGAEDGEDFLTIEELNLVSENEVPFRLVDPFVSPRNPALKPLPMVTGITVNTVHGNERSIAEIVRRLHPQVESMEGAAFMYACTMHDVIHTQIRAVSNVVEKRNRHAWKMTDAIRNLGEAAREIVGHA